MTQPHFRPKQIVEVRSDLAEWQPVQDEILAAARACGYSEPEVFPIHLALEEALVNAVKHGNGSDPSKLVRVEYEVSHDELRVRIEDEGPGFVPTDVPDPTSFECLDRPGGRGVLLMRHYMSEVTYNDRGNCVTMLKRRGDLNSNDAASE